MVPVDGVGGGIGRWIVCVRYLFGEFHSTRCLPQRSFDGGFCEPEEVFPVPLFLELSGLELDGFLVAFIYVTDGSALLLDIAVLVPPRTNWYVVRSIQAGRTTTSTTKNLDTQSGV